MFKSNCAPLVRASVAAVIGGFAVIGGSAAAWSAEAAQDDELAEVQVTGTRIQVAGNYTAANPITSVTGEDLRRLGMVNVSDALTTLVPQNMSTYMPTMVGDEFSGRGAFFIGNTIANLRGLDPTFGSRTLTMIDGRRVVSTSNQADVVDMNIIPSNLLQRMDVVTGGASAAYGSGAMAGVVNMVLNNRMQGINADLDYGVNEAGDGDNKHIALSGGTALLDGRLHALFGVEWQKQSPIRDCAAARAWCAESRSLYTNSGQFGLAPGAPFTGRPEYPETLYPSRFVIDNVRFSQFQPTGAILSTNVNNTTGWRFTADGTGVEQYDFGYRGGADPNAGGGQVLNGDGPLTTTGTTMTPSNERKTAFTNFEFDFTERTTGYLQASYAKTDALNKNTYTQGAACVRFDTQGVPTQTGASLAAGAAVSFWPTQDGIWNNLAWRQFLGITAAPGFSAPYWYFPGQTPNATFTNATGTYTTFTDGFLAGWSVLTGVTITAPFQAPDVPAVLPTVGPNSYAFLNTLSPEALLQVQQAFGRSPATGPGPSFLVGSSPCAGYTAIQKVWNPQFQQYTDQSSETMRTVLGLKGRFGQDWRYDLYYQYGQTESESVQNNVWTTIRLGFAMDAVLDANGQPVCRVTRDGVPTVDVSGLPLSDPEGLAALAEGCKPLNIFGNSFADPVAAQLQRDAINYAFTENGSSGKNSLQTLSFNTSGSLWEGWGAGPLTGAFGVELRQDKVDNAGTNGSAYERADFAFGWADAFGGKTRVYEGFAELNLPIISGQPGVNLWSVNGAVRYARYRNTGGAGTTGESLTQTTTNWKFSTLFEPFDWVRLRVTRSRDLRAAGYRDLFINQPSVPDSAQGTNPWRPWDVNTDAQQQERWGTVTVGNAALKPEKSDTLTIGLVLSPGGWAQGMRLSADYYTIRVKDGINQPFGGASPIETCWLASGNREPIINVEFDHDNNPATPPQIVQQLDPSAPTTLFDPDAEGCSDIEFGVDDQGNLDTTNVVSYNTGRPTNSDPFQRRGIDMSWDYMFPLTRAFEGLRGSVSLTVRATRALESSGVCRGFAVFFGACVDGQIVETVGQIRNSAFIPGVAATPKWTGNVIASWLVDDLTVSLSGRYVGGAVLDKTWADSPDDANYQDGTGRYLWGSVDNNHVKPYFNWSLNGSYNLPIEGMRQFQVFGSINNLFDKDPPFSGGYVSGASPQYHDIMGRAYRFGVRMRF